MTAAARRGTGGTSTGGHAKTTHRAAADLYARRLTSSASTVIWVALASRAAVLGCYMHIDMHIGGAKSC